MNMTETISRVIRNTILHADTYIQDVFHAISSIDNDITWNEDTKTFIVCGRSVKVGSIDGVNGTISFTINGDLKNTIMCPVAESELIMIEALKQMIADEEERIESLKSNIERLHRSNAVQHTDVSLYSRTTGLEAETSDMSTDTVQAIIELVRKDMEVTLVEKYKIINELEEKIAKLTPKKWEWLLPSSSMWGNFDHGEVEGDTYEIALENATQTLMESVLKLNKLLNGEFTVAVDYGNISLTEIK